MCDGLKRLTKEKGLQALSPAKGLRSMQVSGSAWPHTIIAEVITDQRSPSLSNQGAWGRTSSESR